MADIYEVSVAMDLRDDLSEAEITELQWHLGLGPEPEQLSIVPEFPIVMESDLGELVTEDAPAPLLGCHGGAWKVGGAAHLGAGPPGAGLGTYRSARHPPGRLRPTR
ncbi:hypothetical protein ACIGT4_27275 [Streptomyces sioyaensis]|uniref:hypothetical protein n=1 Tax=Streptomyces sioyaensis TaxID=67364 RepID=UPI0037D91379